MTRQDLVTQPICGWPAIRPDGFEITEIWPPLPLSALRCHHSQLNKMFMSVQWVTKSLAEQTTVNKPIVKGSKSRSTGWRARRGQKEFSSMISGLIPELKIKIQIKRQVTTGQEGRQHSAPMSLHNSPEISTTLCHDTRQQTPLFTESSCLLLNTFNLAFSLLRKWSRSVTQSDVRLAV